MNLKQISEELFLSEQLQLADIPLLSEQGYRSIICNRPDGEGRDQPAFSEIKAAADTHDMQVYYLPVVPGKPSGAQVTEFSHAMQELPKPVVAYCRTGTRSASLWTLSQSNDQPDSNLIQAIRNTGDNLIGSLSRIAKRF